MTYEEFEVSIQSVISQITESAFAPDVIVAIARGGWVPARLISRFLKIKKLYNFGVTYADADRTVLTVYDSPSPEIKNQKILLVEDYLESAKSMKFCAEQLQKLNNEVRTFAVGYSNKSVLIPDYSLGIVSEIPKLPWD